MQIKAIKFLSSVVVLTVLNCLGANLLAQSASQNQAILMDDHTISANLQAAPLEKVIQQIRSQSNIVLECDTALLQNSVSVKIENLPIEQGLKRIFANLSNTFIYNKQGAIIKVRIVNKGSENNKINSKTKNPPIPTKKYVEPIISERTLKYPGDPPFREGPTPLSKPPDYDETISPNVIEENSDIHTPDEDVEDIVNVKQKYIGRPEDLVIEQAPNQVVEPLEPKKSTP